MDRNSERSLMTDMEFLIELREHFENGRSDENRYELGLEMITHWIDELKETLDE